MWEKYQQTLKNKIIFSGVGLHSGINTSLTLEPAEANTGIIFKRTDLQKNNLIEANFKNVSSAVLCTKIENEYRVSVSTIEHLMAAFYICGVDNLIVNIDGPEVPIMDGSAKDFVEQINLTGLKNLNRKRKFIKIIKNKKLDLGNKSMSIEPSVNDFTVKFTLTYDNTLINTQIEKTNFDKNSQKDIYTARTFCLFHDIEKIKSMGLGKGGSLENAVVVKGDKILNEGGLRSKNEFVNHKILDLAGDFMLTGMRVIGNVECIHGGHALTNDFLRKLLSDNDNFTIVESLDSASNIEKLTPDQKRIAVNA